MAWDPDSEFGKAWPGLDHPLLVKLRDDLIFAVPPQYVGYWILPKSRWATLDIAPIALTALHRRRGFGFGMFMPGPSGLTPENWQASEFDDRRVRVYIEIGDPAQGLPDAPGAYPENMWPRALQWNPEAPVEEKFGLRCVMEDMGPRLAASTTCYGLFGDDTKE